ncbi:MAG: hypothetical protein K2J10_07635, partial [Muribaculaceae bacterium]|nr:hypothetical protein [Muribaculaceae bacterium]
CCACDSSSHCINPANEISQHHTLKIKINNLINKRLTSTYLFATKLLLFYVTANTRPKKSKKLLHISAQMTNFVR